MHGRAKYKIIKINDLNNYSLNTFRTVFIDRYSRIYKWLYAFSEIVHFM